MSELRTLKDIEAERFGKARHFGIEKPLLDEIKQEAIEWIDKERTKRMNANDFILVFFDVREEDL